MEAVRRLKAAYYLSLSQALGKIAPSVLSAVYADYLEVYKVCSSSVALYMCQPSPMRCWVFAAYHIAVSRISVRLFVRHMSMLCQNE